MSADPLFEQCLDAYLLLEIANKKRLESPIDSTSWEIFYTASTSLFKSAERLWQGFTGRWE